MKKNKKIIYKNFIKKKYLSIKRNKKLSNEFVKTLKDISGNLNKTKNTFHSLSNKFKFSLNFKSIKRFKKYNTVVIIGIGGSILGAEAIYYFLKKKIKKEFIFLNNIDETKINKLKNQKDLNKILFLVVSKSGNTTETLSNFLALKILKRSSKNIIIISEKNDNALHLVAKKMKLFHIEHKNYISGRYSVLSEAGLVAAYLMDINISKLRKNLLCHFNKNRVFLKDSTIKLTNLFKQNKFNNLIFLNYIPELNKFLYWYQQLIAESLGKNKKGFLPVVSPAPKDHHSLLQLYLDGPRNKMFFIFSGETKKNNTINSKNFGKQFNYLNNKSLSKIKDAQKNAFIEALKKEKIPYREFKIQKIDEQTIGELFAYFILETSIVGKLSKINPFDQPAVEQVKINTKKILS